MSNHSGSSMLNDLLHELNDLGLLAHVSDEVKEKLIKKILSLCWKHDCNWGEIIDEELALLLSVCRYCNRIKPDIKKDGYCAECITNEGFDSE